MTETEEDLKAAREWLGEWLEGPDDAITVEGLARFRAQGREAGEARLREVEEDRDESNLKWKELCRQQSERAEAAEAQVRELQRAIAELENRGLDERLDS